MSDVHPTPTTDPGSGLQVVRVLSNNAVLARTAPEADEVILVGRGIGFRRRPGETLPKDAAGRRYVELSTDEVRFLQSMDSLDHAALDVISAAVDLAVDLLGELHPSVYVVLAEHLSFAVQRAGLGETIRNSLLNEIRASFPLEFRAAELMVGYLNSHLESVDLPVDEAAFIALHLNAARTGVTVKQPLAAANALAELVRTVCAQLSATTTALDGTPDRTLAIELNRLIRRVESGGFRTCLLHREITRDLPQESHLSRQTVRPN